MKAESEVKEPGKPLSFTSTGPSDAPVINHERNALRVGKWANLSMAGAGIIAAWASHSDAMLVDGLYSGVNFLSAIAAARIGSRVGLPATRSRPWGQDFDETLYVTFRSLILVGVLGFAAILSMSKILTFATGGEVPTLNFVPIAVYSVVIVLICAGLAINYRRAYAKSGGQSAILKTESKAAMVDGVLSVGAGAALLSLPLLKDTPLAPFMPIGDAVVVLILIAVIIWQPLASFRQTLAELAGVSAPASTVSMVAKTARNAARAEGFVFRRVAVLRAGRFHFAAIYIDPTRPVEATEIDAFHNTVKIALEKAIGPTRTEIIVTARSRSLPPGLP
ncbi:cation transporter [Roseibium algae]|uniref:Cation transporter n=1 Tax=Roseibium algae TaxID=3123038 RepID=A0ABU8TIB4_9HYPH